MCKFRFLVFIFLILSTELFSQDSIDIRNFNYQKADSIAIKGKSIKYKNYLELTQKLTADLTTDHEKFRVIYRWICENIKYDYSNRSDKADKALKTKKAVCIGFSTLLQSMCQYADIRCEVIHGTARNETSDIGQKLDHDHAWNAVFLNGEWHLTDVTWAQGYYDDDKRKSFKKFNETYFLPYPETLTSTHFPDDKKWQLKDEPVTKRQFIRSPIKNPQFYADSLELKSKNKGTIKCKINAIETVWIEGVDSTDSFIVNADEESVWYQTTVSGSTAKIQFQLTKPGTYDVVIFNRSKSILEYQATVK